MFRFRAELDVVPTRDAGGREIFVVRDPRSGKVFELEAPDYAICRLFDGLSTLSEVQTKARDQLKHEVTREDLAAFARYLLEEGLLVQGSDGQPTLLPTTQRRAPIIRFGNPDRLLRGLARRLRWCARSACLWLSLVLVAAGMAVLVLETRPWLTGLSRYWHPAFPLFLLLTFVFVVTAVNEISRGLALSYYGMHVSAIGLRFVLRVVPRFYVDSSQFQLLRDKKARLWVSFVAAYSLVVLWAGTMVGWHVTQKGSYLNLLFWITSLIAGIWGLLFVWNPLRRGELHQLLATWLEIPRLQHRAWNAARSWLLRRPGSEPSSPAERRAFILYGVASAAWLAVVVGALLISVWGWLTGHYAGSGAVLFAALLTLGLLQMRGRATSTVQEVPALLEEPRRPWRTLLRWTLRLAVLGTSVWALLLPVPYRVGGDVTLRPTQRLSVASEIDGIVGRVRVVEGSWVNAGDVMADLVSRDYDHDLKVATAARTEAEARLALLLAGPKPEEVAEATQRVQEARVAVEYSEVRLKRIAEVYRKGMTSDQDHDDARANRDLKKEQLASARAHLAVVQSGARPEEIEAQRDVVERLKAQEQYAMERLDETKLVSTIAGRVATAHIDEQVGRRLEPGDELGVVEDTRIIQAEALLLQDDIGLVSVGEPCDVRLWPFPRTVFEGTVSQISPVAVEEVNSETKVVSQRVRVVIEIPNPDGRLKSGMTGYAKVQAGTRPLWWVLSRRIREWVTIEFWSWLPV